MEGSQRGWFEGGMMLNVQSRPLLLCVDVGVVEVG